MFCRHSQDQPQSTQSHQLTVTDSTFCLLVVFSPSFPQDKNNSPSFLSIYVYLFILCMPFVVVDVAIILFVSRRGGISKGLIMQTGPVISSKCLRWDLLSLTSICLCAVSCSRPEYKHLFLSPGLHWIQPHVLERDVFGGGDHAATSNS